MHHIDTDERCAKCHLTLKTITLLGGRVGAPLVCNDAPVRRDVRSLLAILRELPPGRHAPTQEVIASCRLCEARLSLLKTELQTCPMNPTSRDDLLAMLAKYGIHFTSVAPAPSAPEGAEPVCSTCGGAHWLEEHALQGRR